MNLSPKLHRIAFLLLFACPLCAQSTHVVPVDFPTIQLAIDASQDGDVVLVQPGTYTENISFLGKAITVVSSGGPDVTSINGSAMTAGPEIGSVVRFETGEGPNSILDGFEIACGSGTLAQVSFAVGEVGGGIFGTGASPTIRNCQIRNNSAAVRGGGAYFDGVTGDLVLQNVTIENCIAGNGGGLFCVGTGSATIVGCELLNNTGTSDIAGAMIGTVRADIRNSRFAMNLTGSTALVAGGLFLGNSFGTEFVQPTQTAIVDSCVFEENDAAFGGAAVVFNTQASFDSCVIRGNTGVIAGFVVDVADINLRNCFFLNNNGSGASCLGSSTNPATISLENCTLAANQGNNLITATGPATVVTCRNTIIWGNTGVNPFLLPTPPTVTYCDVEGGFPGIGNLAVDPLFVDPANGDFRLLANSPCIDAGDPTSPLDPDGTIADMGAAFFAGQMFQRGDANSDGNLNLADVIRILGFLFANGPALDCDDAGDVSDDGSLDIADAVFFVNFLFSNGPEPPAPYLGCGEDPTPDGLPCQTPTQGC